MVIVVCIQTLWSSLKGLTFGHVSNAEKCFFVSITARSSSGGSINVGFSLPASTTQGSQANKFPPHSGYRKLMGMRQRHFSSAKFCISWLGWCHLHSQWSECFFVFFSRFSVSLLVRALRLLCYHKVWVPPPLHAGQVHRVHPGGDGQCTAA